MPEPGWDNLNKSEQDAIANGFAYLFFVLPIKIFFWWPIKIVFKITVKLIQLIFKAIANRAEKVDEIVEDSEIEDTEIKS